MNDQTNADLYKKLVELGTSLKDAAAVVDAFVLSFDEWKEAHCLERREDAQHLPDHE